MRMIASTGAEMVTFTLPAWTAICSFMVVSHVAQPQHRCLATYAGGLALEVTGAKEGCSRATANPLGFIGLLTAYRPYAGDAGGVDAVSRMAACPPLRVSRIHLQSV